MRLLCHGFIENGELVVGYILLFVMYDYQTLEICRKFFFLLFSIATTHDNCSHHFVYLAITDC